ncbi:MAG: 4Fe-4S dicluster domain-containing protein [Candidatus Marinimicrobia bacterium]|nr:4Fe-4S dicluster domain-containing protein [Candidatus Neomarinimicrobiota bacterium]
MLPLVRTIKDRCKVCYTCVRECPAKAIRISDGQAEVIPERCIGCGNCYKVCSQKAKEVLNSIPDTIDLLENYNKVAAIIAPSFPAEFAEVDYMTFVGMVRKLGFEYVNEVGFGADLVARKMRELFADNKTSRFISTACPAVFGYVKRYHPELIDKLAPVVSPMVATARALKKLHGKDLKVVFIGPCIAKKGEALSDDISGEVDVVLTFEELKKLFKMKKITPNKVKPSDFDPPYARRGAMFPIGGGLLQAAEIPEDLTTSEVVSANGRDKFIDAILEFAGGDLSTRFLDVLCCDGCIMGAGMTSTEPLLKRRVHVSNYVNRIMTKRDLDEWVYFMNFFKDLDLSRTFKPIDTRLPNPSEEEIRKILRKMGKRKKEDELNCGACGYETCREHAIAIYKGLAESEMCLPYTIEKLHKTIQKLDQSNKQLVSIREALIQSEKLASMGQMAAGIAHELNNPLGVVIMYANLILEQLNPESEIYDEVKILCEEAERCKGIVSGLLSFARENKVDLQPVNIKEFIGNCLRLIKPPSNVAIRTEYNIKNPIVTFDKNQMVQVITNMLKNSFDAMPEGGEIGISVGEKGDNVVIKISDTGKGIPDEILPKIFDPFFTTKEPGKGTGLGLAIVYGIIKMHRGNIRVKSNTDPAKGRTGTTFYIELPKGETKFEVNLN